MCRSGETAPRRQILPGRLRPINHDGAKLPPFTLGILAMRIFGNVLIARGRPLLESAAIGTALVATIALDVSLIPPFGGRGAAVASTVAYSVGGFVAIAIVARTLGARLAGQMSGNQFEAITRKCISQTFPHLTHLRPGEWTIQQITGRDRTAIAGGSHTLVASYSGDGDFQQQRHHSQPAQRLCP